MTQKAPKRAVSLEHQNKKRAAIKFRSPFFYWRHVLWLSIIPIQARSASEWAIERLKPTRSRFELVENHGL